MPELQVNDCQQFNLTPDELIKITFVILCFCNYCMSIWSTGNNFYHKLLNGQGHEAA
jgi:hypothetical protein